MANPYTSGENLDPFADQLRRPPPANNAAPTISANSSPTQPNVQFYTPAPGQRSPTYDPNQGYTPPPQPTAQPHPGFQQPQHQAAPPPAAKRETTSKFWTLKFYQQFFDVDTSEVTLRMAHSLIPFRPPDFLASRKWHFNTGGADDGAAQPPQAAATEEKYPDLYGPFWICTTLWIALAVVGNAVSLIEHNKKQPKLVLINNVTHTEAVPEWSYDFEAAVVGMGVVYFYTVGMSLLLWGIMKWKEVPVTFVDTLALYGYSMFVFVIGAVASAIPYSSLQWLICGVCGVISTLFLLMNLWHIWKQSLERWWFLLIVGVVAVAHIALTMTFKLYFFNY